MVDVWVVFLKHVLCLVMYVVLFGMGLEDDCSVCKWHTPLQFGWNRNHSVLILRIFRPLTCLYPWPVCVVGKLISWTKSKHKKVQKNAYLLWHGHTICTFSRKSLLSVCRFSGKSPTFRMLAVILFQIGFFACFVFLNKVQTDQIQTLWALGTWCLWGVVWI